MDKIETNEVKECLTKTDVHEQWENDYRKDENEEFYDLAFDYLSTFLNLENNPVTLDVGCGIGAHSVRLARKGFQVVGIDFSQDILNQGNARVTEMNLQQKIDLEQQDILNLSFPDNAFDYILCWGVLMHIPDVDKAISEMKRVLKPGGKIIISEGNMYSIQSIMMRFAKFILKKGDGKNKVTVKGYKTWTTGPAGTHVTRQANINWLIEVFQKDSFTLVKRIPGQFTELYTRFNGERITKLIHGINNIWFRFIPISTLAQGNILIFEKSL